MTTARSTFPIDFDFHNDDEEQVLFITDDVVGQDMVLEVSNISDKPTSLKKLTGKVSANVHHIELVFRPGTLYNNPSAIKLASPQFDMFVNTNGSGNIVPNADGTLSLYFKAKNEWTLQEGEKLSIGLSHLRAAMKGGTRGTRILLKYQNLLHAGNTETISGYREMHLNIVNHRGKRNIPLHVGLIDAGMVLNDGSTPNAIRLRVTNISRKNMIIDADDNSILVLAFDGGPLSQEWALATNTNMAKFVVKATYSGENPVEIKRSTGVNEWQIPFKKLAPDQFIEISVDTIVTKHPTGHAHLQLHHENIPGYWDGQYVCTIEKSPMVIKHNFTGVGTTPNAKLHVVNANQNADGNTLILGPTNQSNLRLGYDKEYSWVQSHGLKPLAINPVGNGVAVGKVKAEATLDVAGTTKINDLTVMGNSQLDPTKSVSVNFGFAPQNQKIIAFKTKYKNDKYRGQAHFYAPSNYYTNKPLLTLAGNYGVGGMAGIGTEAPDALLHVVNVNQNANGNTLILGPTNQSNLRLGYDKEYSWVQSHGAKPLAINPVGNNVGIGTDKPSAKLEVKGGITTENVIVKRDVGRIKFQGNNGEELGELYFSKTTNKFILENKRTGTKVNLNANGNAHLESRNTIFAVQGDGNVAIYQRGRAVWATGTNISDIELKEEVQPITNILPKLTSLDGISFEWKDKELGKDREFGLIAQQVEKVFPELMKKVGEQDKLVQYEKFVPLLIEAIKAQQGMIEELKSQLHAGLSSVVRKEDNQSD